jgi:hypothetical protein
VADPYDESWVHPPGTWVVRGQYYQIVKGDALDELLISLNVAGEEGRVFTLLSGKEAILDVQSLRFGGFEMIKSGGFYEVPWEVHDQLVHLCSGEDS